MLYEAKKVGKSRLIIKRSVAEPAGSKRTLIRGRGMEYVESRPYVMGDELRTIDWRVSARLNKVHTKVYAQERGRPVYVVIDQRSSMFFGSVNCFKSVLAARIAARLSAAAINGNDQIGGIIFDDDGEQECHLGNAVQLAHLLGMLSLSTHKKQRGDNPQRSVWPMILRRLYNRLHPGSVVFLVSDFTGFSLELRPLLARLRRKADIGALLISDPLEESWPHLGHVGMSFMGQRISFDSNDDQLLERYKRIRSEQNQAIVSIFSGIRVPVLQFMTSDDLDGAMRSVLVSRR